MRERELRRQLASALDDELLEDGRTSARELRAALITFEALCEENWAGRLRGDDPVALLSAEFEHFTGSE